MSISAAGVSEARVTIAEVERRSVFAGVGGFEGRTLTFSMMTVPIGIRALIVAGDVPGGREERCSVGFGTAFSAAKEESLVSSSSSVAGKATAVAAESRD